MRLQSEAWSEREKVDVARGEGQGGVKAGLTRDARTFYLSSMFKDALREIVDRTEGGIAGLLMDASGIAVESYSRDNAPFDITTIGVEYGVLLGSIKKAAEMLEAGTANEISISTDKMITIIRTLGPEYFLALAITPEGNFGKGRFLMRTAVPKLLAEL